MQLLKFQLSIILQILSSVWIKNTKQFPDDPFQPTADSQECCTSGDFIMANFLHCYLAKAANENTGLFVEF